MVSQTVSIPRDLYFEVENYALDKKISFSKAYAEFAHQGRVRMLENGIIKH